MNDQDSRRRGVIIGGGFAGLFAARALRRAPVQVTLIEGAEHHLFQPLLYLCGAPLVGQHRWRFRAWPGRRARVITA